MTRLTVHIVRAAMAALALTVTAAAWAQEAGADGGSGWADPTEALVDRLNATRIDATYAGVDFDEIVADLRAKYDLNIHVAWRRLAERGIRRDQRLEIRVEDVPLVTLLDIIVRDMRTDHEEVSYHVENGVIVISTSEDLGRSTILRAYDITDLIESGYAIRRFASTPVLSMHVTGREFVGGDPTREDGRGFGGGGGGRGGGGGGGGGASVFGDPGDDAARPTAMERVHFFIDLIQNNVEPDSWVDFGGDAGRVQAVRSVLLVRQTIRAHRKIAGFLALVRSVQPIALDADAVVLRMRADKVAAWRRAIGPTFPRLPAAAVDAMLAEGDDRAVLFSASGSGFNGQRIWWSALTQRDVLVGAEPVVGEGINAFEPRTGFSTEGLELLALPLVAPGTKTLTLDVQMAWVPPAHIGERAIMLAAGDGGQATATIDQATRSMRTVSTSVKLTLGEAIALSIPSEIGRTGSSGLEDWLILRVCKPRTE